MRKRKLSFGDVMAALFGGFRGPQRYTWFDKPLFPGASVAPTGDVKPTGDVTPTEDMVEPVRDVRPTGDVETVGRVRPTADVAPAVGVFSTVNIATDGRAFMMNGLAAVGELEPPPILPSTAAPATVPASETQSTPALPRRIHSSAAPRPEYVGRRDIVAEAQMAVMTAEWNRVIQDLQRINQRQGTPTYFH